MSPYLDPQPGGDDQALTIVSQAETAFQQAIREAWRHEHDGQMAERWRLLAESYERVLAHLPPEAPFSVASRLGLLAERARRLSALDP